MGVTLESKDMVLEKQNYQWYAIYTRPNSEKKLFESLTDKGIECYLPMKKTLKHWSDRKKWVEEPHFKSYIFVKVSNREFFSALNTYGAVYYVSFGGKAQAIPESQINSIKKFLSQTEREVTLSYERIQKGVNVEVMFGSFKGIQGEVVSMYGQSRLILRLDSLFCSLHVNISKEEVRILENKNLKHSAIA